VGGGPSRMAHGIGWGGRGGRGRATPLVATAGETDLGSDVGRKDPTQGGGLVGRARCDGGGAGRAWSSLAPTLGRRTWDPMSGVETRPTGGGTGWACDQCDGGGAGAGVVKPRPLLLRLGRRTWAPMSGVKTRPTGGGTGWACEMRWRRGRGGRGQASPLVATAGETDLGSDVRRKDPTHRGGTGRACEMRWRRGRGGRGQASPLVATAGETDLGSDVRRKDPTQGGTGWACEMRWRRGRAGVVKPRPYIGGRLIGTG